jgi:hypothetical protein
MVAKGTPSRRSESLVLCGRTEAANASERVEAIDPLHRITPESLLIARRENPFEIGFPRSGRKYRLQDAV